MAIVTKQQVGLDEVSLLPTTLNLNIYKNDTIEIIFALEDFQGNAVDIADWIGSVNFKDISNNIAAHPQVFVNYGSVGIVRVFLSDTSRLPVGQYSYTLQLTDSAGRKRTFLAGIVTITGE